MSQQHYPIINGNCQKCLACTLACPLGLLGYENNQINLAASEKCPDACTKCSIVCHYDAIFFYDGTPESILKAFETNACKCGCH